MELSKFQLSEVKGGTKLASSQEDSLNGLIPYGTHSEDEKVCTQDYRVDFDILEWIPG